MQIAYITGEYPRATDTFIQREVFALRDRGVDVHTFSIRRTGDEHIVGPEQQSERDRTFYVLPISSLALVITHLGLLFQLPKHYLKALKLAWSTRQPGLSGIIYQLFYFAEAGIVAKQMRVRKLSHIHNHAPDSSGTVTMLAAEMGNFTFSVTLHGPYIFFSPERWHLEEKLKRSLFISCISHFARSQGMLFTPVDVWKRMHIVHCGVTPALFNLVSHTGIGCKLLYVGRLAATKGLPILLESLVVLKKTFPDLVLTVVGDGSDKILLQNMVEELKLQQAVEFVGYQSQTKVREYIQHTDIFVLPSFAEGIPVVLMEAMAAGVPVVSTRIAGISELVEHGVSGYLVPPGDVTSLASAITTLLVNDQLRTAFGVAGRTAVEKNFNLEKEAKHLHSVLTSVLTDETEVVRLSSHEESKIYATQNK